ncbi:hypothetical protein Tco_0785029 [Tanacetum coccineum]
MVMVMVIPIIPKQAITTYMMIFMVGDFFSAATTGTGTGTTGTTATIILVDGTVVRKGKLWTGKSNFATEFTEIMYWNYVYRNERVVNNVAKEQPSKKFPSCDKEDTIDRDPVLSQGNNEGREKGCVKYQILCDEPMRGKALDWEVKRRREKALDWEVMMSIDDIVMEFAIEFTEIMYWNYVYRNEKVANNVARNNRTVVAVLPVVLVPVVIVEKKSLTVKIII